MKCVSCSSKEVDTFLSMGELPLGNAFLKDREASEKKFDLDLGFCKVCSLVQQTNPPPEGDLREDYMNYRYVPVGPTLTKNLEDLGRSLVADFDLKLSSLVIDIGSNQGDLLCAIKDDVVALGVEPAYEISESARKRGVNTITDFFSPSLVGHIVSRYGKADVVVMTQTLQHLPNPRLAVQEAARMLRPDGVLVVEGRYFADTIKKCSYDTVYHEMLDFFTLHSYQHLIPQATMEVFRAQRNEVYGGSLRIYASKLGRRRVDSSIVKILGQEDEEGLTRYETYEKFGTEAVLKAERLHDYLKKLKEAGATIAGYGAPSTSATLINFSRIGPYIDYVADKNVLKQNLYTPGSKIPIVSPEQLTTNRPEYILLLAWRLKNEILPELKGVMDQGTKVIIPLPEIELIQVRESRRSK